MLSLPPPPRPDGLQSSSRAQKAIYPAPSNPPLGPASTSRLHLQMSLRPQHRQSNDLRPREDPQIRMSSNPPGRGRSEKRSWTQARLSHDSASLPPNLRSKVPGSRLGRPSGDGYTIWNTVTNAASALTVSVSNAWNSQIKTESGEDTPPGQESRLTRAMKAYHTARAQNPSDLPGWLFNERERSVLNVSRHSDTDIRQEIDFSPPQMRAESDISSAPVTSASIVSHQRPELRGVDRLKALRSTKRGTPTQHQKSDSTRSDDSNLGDTVSSAARKAMMTDYCYIDGLWLESLIGRC
ncbi:hypothetical protein Agabi119p4_3106 [Agaricus bisporus var. burnettii]|uniref:Uncharacterized protein n=1 Tax=Agaricus bisporus var. burnettii TaxID=192524 RepID=A0A8H7KJ26_AGABI|nr:hypothetical protein Agabi119p4_3106 [Agaricus bisporus var. burnettii]